MKKLFFLPVVCLCLVFMLVSSCSSKQKETKTENTNEQEAPKGPDFSNFVNSIYSVQTFKGDRLLETGQGFVADNNILALPFSFVNDADRAIITPLNGGKKLIVNKFVAYDRISNLVLLYSDSLLAQPLSLYSDSFITNVITYIAGSKANSVQPLFKGKCLQKKIVQGQEYFNITNNVLTNQRGAPIFVSTGKILGMATFIEEMGERNYFAIPAGEIARLLSKKSSPQQLTALSNPDSKRNASIKRIVLETDYGNIVIRLFNETPTYRDNFVKLAKEGFYDNLLIHRVIRDFGIQSGAADTRNAASDDVVGWKGPGYTLPAYIERKLIHKRGAIGSPRKPDTQNREKRSDGSQFYIVTGRKYLDDELNDIEKENGIKFTAAEREMYKTIGGAPHLDGEYTVFGEVVSGLEIADRISLLPTKNDFRPLTDIRLKRVKIEW